MGLNQQKEWILSTRLVGDERHAASHVNTVARIVEKLQEQMDEFEIESQVNHTTQLDDRTSAVVTILPGGIVTTSIHAAPLLKGGEEQEYKLPEDKLGSGCPPLPVPAPNKEGTMFSDLVGLNLVSFKSKSNKNVTLFRKTLDPGEGSGTSNFSYPDENNFGPDGLCGFGETNYGKFWYRGNLQSNARIPYMGQLRSKYFYDGWDVTFMHEGEIYSWDSGSDYMIDFYAGGCVPAGDISDIQIGAGLQIINAHNVWDNYSGVANGEPCSFTVRNDSDRLSLFTGFGGTPEDWSSLDEEFSAGQLTSVSAILYDGEVLVPAGSEIIVRHVIIFKRPQMELIYVYPGGVSLTSQSPMGCPAAWGWFYSEMSPGTPTDTFAGRWMFPEACALGGTSINERVHVIPVGMTDQNFQARMYGSGNRDNISKKAFWVYMDGNGYPIGSISSNLANDNTIQFS